MLNYILAYAACSLITLVTIYWALTFVAQVKNNEKPYVKIKLNPVQVFERNKKKIESQASLLRNG